MQDNNNNNNNNQNNNNKRQQRFKFDIISILLVIITIVAVILFIRQFTQAQVKQISVSDFLKYVEQGNITGQLASAPAGYENYNLFKISGTVIDGTTTYNFYVYVTSAQLEQVVEEYNSVQINITALQPNVWLSILVSLLPSLILIGLLIWMMKSQGGNSKAFDFAKSTAKLAKSKTVTFADVAGCDEEKAELVEIVDFLKNPKKYSDIGARVPKGVLLFGSPGTGKTLLAKAVAGEAGVPFFSISGSDFVEMFVGVGAARVRDMFKTAKQNAPCIVFIDEIDAVGRQRGAGIGGGQDEREQTLNQLLVEMDGFTNNTGIIVIAATNRPDVLDPALLRPGRFDRQITIANPDVKGREAILRVHARNKNFDKEVNFDAVARRTPGFSGAELENILNEAALLAARANRTSINMQDIDEATDRVMMGPAKKSRAISDKEKNIIAHHEAGHAVIGLKLENANIVQKVTIIPRGQAGGYALMLPEEEHYLYTKQDFLDKITGYLGGRVSEELNFKDVTQGASNDFEQATKIARAMVTEYGMSDLGPIQYEQQSGNVFLGRDYLKDKNFSDQVALDIDKEVRKIIESCYERAKKVLQENMDLVELIAQYLIKVETLTKQDIDEIVETGHLGWYERQEAEKAKKAEEARLAKEAEEKAKAEAEAVKKELEAKAVEAQAADVKTEEVATEEKTEEPQKEEKSEEDNTDEAR